MGSILIPILFIYNNQVSRAKTTAAKVNTELTELKSLLKNIETARPLEDLTVRLVIIIIIIQIIYYKY